MLPPLNAIQKVLSGSSNISFTKCNISARAVSMDEGKM
ncbi:hypothetical protein M067_1956 [Bacteroides fragilis str. J-143-4]|uniref:Uncharacterized protein n=1 Tax=Bacteroides fragilis str. S36L11 TaxID=1339327 RepID=A0A015YAA1_BACFG|nr:hypothetical protein M121_1639 [Bacteroides fragilis str. 3783N2-1]EXY56346.1 hypothetical protein M122_1591 [Bacteroides fragilis str. 3976T7]EXZ19616.1 hypothetical protein M067_1956 [Bacteroides fragilis str. J-143-4]EXZ28887.1 hypothetical protein M136_1901 [Bacteroides fragilis str. S36L11]